MRLSVDCGGVCGPLHVHALDSAPADSRDAYAARTWPAAVFLASLVCADPTTVRDLRVLELGCGNGLCSLAAARAGARSVLATDYSPLAVDLVERAAADADLGDILRASIFDFASPMPPAAVISSRSRASRIAPSAATLPPHDVLLAADVGYSPSLAWRLGERCGLSLRAGARVLVAESRQMPMCRRAFSEALNLWRADVEPLRLSAADAAVPALAQAGFAEVAVGGDDDAPMWILDARDGHPPVS